MRRSSFSIIAIVLCMFFARCEQVRADDVFKNVVRHYVAFKFKDGTTPAQIDEIVGAFKNLRTQIPNVLSIEAGVNDSPENLNKGLTHGFIVTFPSEKDRDVYLTHPNHKKFLSLALPSIADVFVLDFSTPTADGAGTASKGSSK